MEYIAPKQYKTYGIYRREMSNRVSRLLDRQIKEFIDRLDSMPEHIRVLVSAVVDLSNPN